MSYKESFNTTDKEDIYELDYWKSYTYDQREMKSHADIDYLRKLLSSKSQKVLEIACGSGRICIPLALDGHKVKGIDISQGMLDVLNKKIENTPLANLKVVCEDALRTDWGSDYDCVILAGNLMMNIIPSYSYKRAQNIFIKKAKQAISDNGIVYIDFSLWSDPTKIFHTDKSRFLNVQKLIYEAQDDHGNKGAYYGLGSYYSTKTHINKQPNKIVVNRPNGHIVEKTIICEEHIPDLNFVHKLLEQNGLYVVAEYGDYKEHPISNKTERAIIIAKKYV